MSPDEPLRLTQADLYSPQITSYLLEQEAMRRGIEEVEPQSLFVRIIYSNWFYLAVAGALGALVAWAILEPFFDDASMEEIDIAAILLFPTVMGLVGLFLGGAEGIMCRNLSRGVRCGVVGLGVGFVGGLIALIPTGIVFAITTAVALQLWDNPNPAPTEMPTGMALMVLMMGRAAAWAIASIPSGLGQGIALQEKKVIVNGIVGALLGGLVGGLLFDPISLVFITDDGQATVSRAIGFVCIGMMVGLFVGLVEGWTKTAWLHMRKGPLAGKQFVIYRDTVVLGSAPKADIYLFKDEAIEPRHALIHNRGGRFEIEDCNTADGTYVNGIPVQQRHALSSGDQIVMGKTVLEFILKDK